MEPNDVLEIPYTETPHTLIGVYPVGHVYYVNFDHEPTPEEYFQAGVRLSEKMVSTIGQRPKTWHYLPTSEVNFARLSDQLRTPIHVL